MKKVLKTRKAMTTTRKQSMALMDKFNELITKAIETMKENNRVMQSGTLVFGEDTSSTQERWSYKILRLKKKQFQVSVRKN